LLNPTPTSRKQSIMNRSRSTSTLFGEPMATERRTMSYSRPATRHTVQPNSTPRLREPAAESVVRRCEATDAA
jgi:hypothetical protein